MEDDFKLVPWGLHPLSKMVVEELKRRSVEYGSNPTATDKKIYSGPRTAWARVFSNGKSKHPDARGKDGFVIGGVFGFDKTYGFNSSKNITIGVDAKGQPHQIPYDVSSTLGIDNREIVRSDFPHRPAPGITSVFCELSGANSSFPNLCRKIKVNWKCNSLAQLNYMIPYFLTPRISCLVEWGWNNYDTNSLVDLQDLRSLNDIFVNPQKTYDQIKKSKGNYDIGMGFIVDYGYSINESGGYDCYTVIINVNRLLEGEQINYKTVSKKKKNGPTPENSSFDPIKGFKEFIEINLSSIDSEDSKYTYIRNRLKLETRELPIKHRVFRISKNQCDKNEKNEAWVRMDLVQDIINAFFQIQMVAPGASTLMAPSSTNSTIRKFDISDTILCSSPFLKSANANVLVPNQYAPRFTSDTDSSDPDSSVFENLIYKQLFKSTVDKIVKEYGVSKKFDNLKEAINPNGQSFPVYETKENAGKSGYWGYLKDLYINVEYFKQIVANNDSVLKMLEQLLQGINESLCQICQLKLVPDEYGNAEYSVIDENWTPIQDEKDARKLEKITLGSINSAYIRSAKFDVKVSSEMMNQLVMQSANPQNDPDGSTPTKNVKATPVVSRYTDGDRLYELGKIASEVDADSGLSISSIGVSNDAEEAKELEKRKASRSEKNTNSFVFYYKQAQSGDIMSYIICETNNEFLNYVLTLEDPKLLYLNNAIMPGTILTLEFLGIAGINYLSQFLLAHAPEAYNYENAVWQVSDIRHTIEDKNWTTTIIAQVRPLTAVKSKIPSL